MILSTRSHSIAGAAAIGLLALAAAAPAWAQQQPPQLTRAEARTVAAACQADVKRICPDVPRGKGRIAACLQENAAAVTPGCRSAIAKVMNK